MAMTFAIVVFPGSNCDHDAYHAVKHVLGQPAHFLWHKDTSLQGADVVILPGGFSYGDYLRTGAVARFSPVMKAVSAFAARGGPVLGICNGFQVLTEAGLLEGAVDNGVGRLIGVRLGGKLMLLSYFPICRVVREVVEQVLGNPDGLDIARQVLMHISKRQPREERVHQLPRTRSR